MRSHFLFSLLFIVAACGGKQGPDYTTISGSSASPIAPPLTPDQQAPFDAASVAAAVASCSAPHGPIDPATTPSTISAKLVGAWYHCDMDPVLGVRWQAVEFDPDGTVSVLIDDGSGGLMRGEGIDNQGTWNLIGYGDQEQQSDGPDATYYLDVYGAGAGSGVVAQFETSPRRLDYEEAESKWFVSLTRVNQ